MNLNKQENSLNKQENNLNNQENSLEEETPDQLIEHLMNGTFTGTIDDNYYRCYKRLRFLIENKLELTNKQIDRLLESNKMIYFILNHLDYIHLSNSQYETIVCKYQKFIPELYVVTNNLKITKNIIYQHINSNRYYETYPDDLFDEKIVYTILDQIDKNHWFMKHFLTNLARQTNLVITDKERIRCLIGKFNKDLLQEQLINLLKL